MGMIMAGGVVTIQMPVVRPVQIPTVGLPWYKKIVAFFKTRRWELVAPFELYVECLKATVYIPAPFVFNFASIPRVLWPVSSPTDLLLLGSVPHDFGYEYGGLVLRRGCGLVFVRMGRADLDEILNEVTVQYNEMEPMADTAWAFVRGFGWVAWWKNRRDNRDVYADYPGLFV